MMKNLEENIEAFDSGPGNCMIDEWVRKNSKNNFDANGSIAKSGKIDQLILNQVIDNFKIDSFEKSLDIKDLMFHLQEDYHLKTVVQQLLISQPTL